MYIRKVPLNKELIFLKGETALMHQKILAKFGERTEGSVGYLLTRCFISTGDLSVGARLALRRRIGDYEGCSVAEVWHTEG